MKKSIALLFVLALLMLQPFALASEIGELPAVTPTPIEQETVAEPAEEDTHLPITEVSIPGAAPVMATMDDLAYELYAGVLDADGNWLYGTGDSVSWNNLPEGYKVGYCLCISNYGAGPIDVAVTEIVDGEECDRGSVTIDGLHLYNFWRYYGTPQDSAHNVAFKVNGQQVIEKTLNFTLAGAPENLELTLAACELDADGNWVRDLEDTVSRSQIAEGNDWGYVLHVWNNGAESVTLRIYDCISGNLDPWNEDVIEPGKGLYYPCSVREGVEGERVVYYTINGEKVAEKTIVFVQE